MHSAPVEELFSLGGELFWKKRHALTDKMVVGSQLWSISQDLFLIS